MVNTNAAQAKISRLSLSSMGQAPKPLDATITMMQLDTIFITAW